MTPPSRWRTGTLAVAGTIPVRSVNAAATLVRSEGHHPAGYRPAVPTRVYESGSDGGSRHAVPVRHPCPKPRPPPQGKGRPESPCPWPRPSSAHRTRRQGRLRRRCASAPRPCDPGRRLARSGSYPGHEARPARPRTLTETTTNRSNQARTRRRTCKSLTGRFILDLRPPRRPFLLAQAAGRSVVGDV